MNQQIEAEEEHPTRSSDRNNLPLPEQMHTWKNKIFVYVCGDVGCVGA